MEFRPPRLVLRSWRDTDLPPFGALNADPEGRHWFPGVLTRQESDGEAARLRHHDEQHGFTFWAVEAPGGAAFIGFIGLLVVRSAMPFAPAVEIGWRLTRAHWGRDYATAAAAATLTHAFRALDLPEIVASPSPATRP